MVDCVKGKVMLTHHLSTSYDDVDGHSSGSDHRLDEEFGIPTVKMPGVKKAMEGL